MGANLAKDPPLSSLTLPTYGKKRVAVTCWASSLPSGYSNVSVFKNRRHFSGDIRFYKGGQPMYIILVLRSRSTFYKTSHCASERSFTQFEFWRHSTASLSPSTAELSTIVLFTCFGPMRVLDLENSRMPHPASPPTLPQKS